MERYVSTNNDSFMHRQPVQFLQNRPDRIKCSGFNYSLTISVTVVCVTQVVLCTAFPDHQSAILNLLQAIFPH